MFNPFAKNNLGWLLPAAVVFFLPFESMVFVPLVIMSLLGVHYFFRDRLDLTYWMNSKYYLLALAFALIWGPMLLSLPDAANFQHSFKTTISLLPYFFVGLFMIIFVDTREIRNRLFMAILVITSFWCVDALIQLLTGSNILGDEYIVPTRLTGVFHPSFTLGFVLAVFMPVALEQLRRLAKGYGGLIIASIIASLHIAVIILSGSKTSLLMMILAIVLWFICIIFTYRKFQWRRFMIVLAVCIPLAGVLSIQQPSRLDSLLNIFNSDIKQLDKISSSRFSLWEATVKISKDHWINGIGPRGFRYVYKEYKPEPGKYNREFRTASTHPHFALLEILSETGVIGLFSIGTLIVILFRTLRNVPENLKMDVYPWFLGVFIAIVPNIAKSFYSSFLMSIVLCMIFTGIACINHEQKTMKA